MEAVRFDGPIITIEGLEDCELVIETCITRTLSPVVTLERGLQSIREAVEELKLNHPPSSSGILRFQVIRNFQMPNTYLHLNFTKKKKNLVALGTLKS